MKSKLYKTHRPSSYYRLRRWSYFSLSLIMATLLVVVPLTFAQASTTSSSQDSVQVSSSEASTTSISTSDVFESSAESSESSSESTPPIETNKGGTHHGYYFITEYQNP